MKKHFDYSIIRAIFIFLFLLFVLYKNEQFYIRIMIICFLLLIGCHIGEKICQMCNKMRGVYIFHKLFSMIAFLLGLGFLMTWSYLSLKQGQYFMLLLIVPLWIFGIYMVRKSLLGIDSKQNQKDSKFNFVTIVVSFLVLFVLLSGIICITLGIKETQYMSKKAQNYFTTTAYFKDYEIYDSHKKEHEQPTYRLAYVYKVNGIEYTIKTDYGSGVIPNTNDMREIKYNPNHPQEAVFIGTTKNSILIYFGVFFFLGGMVFILAFLYIMGFFDKMKINVMGIYVGIALLIIGIGLISFQMGETYSLMGAVKKMGFWICIPIIFIFMGVFQIIKCLFFERLQPKKTNNKK